jgi:hypothetical protein
MEGQRALWVFYLHPIYRLSSVRMNYQISIVDPQGERSQFEHSASPQAIFQIFFIQILEIFQLILVGIFPVPFGSSILS